MAGNFGSIIKAIAAKWAATVSLNGMTLYYGRVDESVKTFPRASFFQVGPDAEQDAYDATRYLTDYLVQIDVRDVDPDNVATVMEAIRATYHRQPLTLDTGVLVKTMRQGGNISIDPELSSTTAPVYWGWVRLIFTVDSI